MQTPYYVFNADEFVRNYHELESAFKQIYPNYQIAYSFKTNYTPAVCKLVYQLGGYAEVVSDMEYELARRIGFPPEHIVYNGPGKQTFFEECMINGGLLNLDNMTEVNKACIIKKEGLSVGLRVNFDVGNGLHSRFGIDVTNGDLESAVCKLNNNGIKVNGIHFHISRARGLNSWKKRIDSILEVSDKVESLQSHFISYIDLGSGMFGNLGDDLRAQFGDAPSYNEYADVVAGTMNDHYVGRLDKPLLLTEPGTTLVSRYFSLFSSVIDIKQIRGKHFALLDCSFHNVGEICGLKKIPMRIVSKGLYEKEYEDVDLVGYTCLEQDVIYHGYSGGIRVGDIIEFSNVGGYSIVDKPPFIHPDIPIYMIKNGEMSCIKRAQTMEDIFAPYYF